MAATPIYARPVFWALMAAIAAAAYLNGGDAPPPKSLTASRRSARAADAGWDFPAPDKNVRFAKPGKLSRNPFVPLVDAAKPNVPQVKKEDEELVQIPSNFADGEGGWAYTGMAEVDGVRMALLENGGSKQSGYVREGEIWKKAHVVGISPTSIVLADDRGTSQTVFRFNPNDPPKAKAEPPSGFRPLDLSGRIGGGLQVRPIAGASPAFFPASGARQ